MVAGPPLRPPAPSPPPGLAPGPPQARSQPTWGSRGSTELSGAGSRLAAPDSALWCPKGVERSFSLHFAGIPTRSRIQKKALHLSGSTCPGSTCQFGLSLSPTWDLSLHLKFHSARQLISPVAVSTHVWLERCNILSLSLFCPQGPMQLLQTGSREEGGSEE